MQPLLPGLDPALPVITRAQALAFGYDDSMIRRMVKSGAWHRIRAGAYMDAAAWQALDALGQHRARARAVLRKTRSEAILSGTSAYLEYQLPAWELDLEDVHVTRLDQRAGRREAGVRQHRGRLFVADVTRRGGLLMTSPTRTVLDVIAGTDSEHGLVAAWAMVRSGECTVEQVRHAYASVEARPHSLATRVVLDLVDRRMESVGEVRTSFHLWREELPRPVPQFEIRIAGRVIAVLDFAWPEHKVWLEFDGRVKYQQLVRERETPTDVVLREKRREDEIRRLTGWICVRVTWLDLQYPARLAAKIRAAFAQQAAA